MNNNAYPWSEFLSPEDKIGTKPTYENGLYISLFEKKVFPAIDPAVGDLTYYVFDPVAHGADPNRSYPLLYWFHGAGNALAGENVLPYSGAERFASPEFQRLMGGAYIVCPVANETADERGEAHHTWMTPVPLEPKPAYDPAMVRALRERLGDADGFWNDLLGSDSQYAPTLKALLDIVRARFPAIDRVFVAGTSAGGYCAWRFILDYPDAADACLIMAGAYLPAPSELDALERAGIPIWICHGLHDEAVLYDAVIAPILERLRAMPNVELTLLPLVRHGDYSVASNRFGDEEIGQHCICCQIAQNLIYDDGKPYDPAHPDGVTGWFRKQYAKKKA